MHLRQGRHQSWDTSLGQQVLPTFPSHQQPCATSQSFSHQEELPVLWAPPRKGDATHQTSSRGDLSLVCRTPLGSEFSLQRSRQAGEGDTRSVSERDSPNLEQAARARAALPGHCQRLCHCPWRGGSLRTRSIPCCHPWALPSVAELCRWDSVECTGCTCSNTGEEQT